MTPQPPIAPPDVPVDLHPDGFGARGGIWGSSDVLDEAPGDPKTGQEGIGLVTGNAALQGQQVEQGHVHVLGGQGGLSWGAGGPQIPWMWGWRTSD